MPTQTATNVTTQSLVTVVRSVDPAVVGKTFDIVDGRLTALRRSNNIRRAVASTELTTDTGVDFRQLLNNITEETNSVLVPGLWNGDEDGSPFNIVTEGELSDLTGHPIGSPEFSKILTVNGERYSARLKRAIAPSCWMLFDFDRGVAGMPDAWRALPLLDALNMYGPLIPGLSGAEKIYYRSSSARVVGPGRPAGDYSHCWVRVNAPAKIETLMRHLQVAAVINDLAFQSPRYSQTTGDVIGQQWRGLFDWSVMITGRLVFTSKPILTPAAQDAGYSIMPADVKHVAGGVVDLTSIQTPVASDLAEYHRRTGLALEFREGNRDGSSLSIHVSGILDYDTPITSRGNEAPFGEWLAGMQVGQTLRCEAPFRDSISEAAFIRCTGPNQGFVYDIGVGETYTLSDEVVERRTAREAASLGQALLRRVAGDEGAAMITAAAEREIARNVEQAELPLIMVDKEHPEQTAAAIMPYLRNIEHHPMWAVGGYMLFVDGAKLINVDRSDRRHKIPVLGTVRINAAHLLEMIPRIVNLQQYRGRNLVACKPSQDVINILLNSPDVKDHLPLYRGMSGTPFMRPDGSICQTQGYDEATGIWLQTSLDVEVPENPTRDDALDALATLRSLLTEMHFASYEGDTPAIDESVALAAMMGVVLRPSFEACPAVIINGTAAGAGKSYFTKLLGTLATGKDPAMNSWPMRTEELDKTLDSLLVAGVPIIAFDNANGVKIGGQKICSIVSESEISTRMLGATQNLKLPTRGVSMIINGNRVEAREDFAARAMTLQLAPNVVIAREYHFRGNPLAEVRANRATYVEAVLTIARSFRVRTEETQRLYLLPHWQGFGEWSDTIRSALVWLGCMDPVRSITDAVQADDDTQGVTLLVRAAVAFRPDRSPWKVAEFVAYLASHAETAAELREALDPEETHGIARMSSLLADWLRRRVQGRTVDLGGNRLATIVRYSAGSGNNVARWQVIDIN